MPRGYPVKAIRCAVCKRKRNPSHFEKEDICRDCDGVMGEKRCRECKKVRPISMFYRDKNSSDGRHANCCACESKRKKKNLHREREKLTKLRGSNTPQAFHSSEKPHPDICCCCPGHQQYKLPPRDRYIERRPTGVKGALEEWVYCHRCWRERQRQLDCPIDIVRLMNAMRQGDGITMGRLAKPSRTPIRRS